MDRVEEYSDEDFKKAIVALAKDRNILGENGRLSKEQVERLDNNIYAHIANVLDREDTPETANPISTGQSDSRNTNIAATIKDWLFGGFANAALAVCTLAAVGAVVFYALGTQSNSILPELPDSLAQISIDQYTPPSFETARGITEKPLTEIRQAFLTGVAKASIDISQDDAQDKTIAVNFKQYVDSKNPSVVSENLDIKWLEERIEIIGTNKNSRQWLNQGYVTEVLNLSATRSMVELDFSLASSALTFYQKESTKNIGSNDIPTQVVENHRYLLSLQSGDIKTPDDIQSLIDRTNNIKVVIE